MAGLIFVSPHFVKSTLGVGESENDNFLVGLFSESPHFVKSTFGIGDCENNNILVRLILKGPRIVGLGANFVDHNVLLKLVNCSP